jgi:hypothetical protein
VVQGNEGVLDPADLKVEHGAEAGVTTASWVPAWYELDQSISVGVVDKFGFARRRTKSPITGWPRLVEAWLGTIGMTSK